MEMVFSPDDYDLYLGGEVPLTYSVDPDDEPGAPGKLVAHINANDPKELDELLNSIGVMGFSEVDTKADPSAIDDGEPDDDGLDGDDDDFAAEDLAVGGDGDDIIDDEDEMLG